MPFLDSTALESDPDGLAFLRSVLKPRAERRGPWLPLRPLAQPARVAGDTTVEVLVDAADERHTMAAVPARA